MSFTLKSQPVEAAAGKGAPPKKGAADGALQSPFILEPKVCLVSLLAQLSKYVTAGQDNEHKFGDCQNLKLLHVCARNLDYVVSVEGIAETDH